MIQERKDTYIWLVAIIAITNGTLKACGYLVFLRKGRSVLGVIPGNLFLSRVLVL